MGEAARRKRLGAKNTHDGKEWRSDERFLRGLSHETRVLVSAPAARAAAFKATKAELERRVERLNLRAKELSEQQRAELIRQFPDGLALEPA